jgi:hypothetical protein
MIGARCDLRYKADKQTARKARGQEEARHEDKFTLLCVGVTCDCSNFVDKLLVVLISYDATELCDRVAGHSGRAVWSVGSNPAQDMDVCLRALEIGECMCAYFQECTVTGKRRKKAVKTPASYSGGPGFESRPGN